MLRYAHTNLIARDARALIAFYRDVLGCESIGQTRDLSGDWLDRLTGIPGAHIAGEHLALPGCGGKITLEIFEYGEEERASRGIGTPGFGHIAFEVDDVARKLADVRARGGGQISELVKVDYPDGRRGTFVYATDPEGNVVELQSWEKQAAGAGS
jgi:catechol 2,3-dioxygenase-like lactoylglutathione lyase family enzyme